MWTAGLDLYSSLNTITWSSPCELLVWTCIPVVIPLPEAVHVNCWSGLVFQSLYHYLKQSMWTAGLDLYSSPYTITWSSPCELLVWTCIPVLIPLPEAVHVNCWSGLVFALVILLEPYLSVHIYIMYSCPSLNKRPETQSSKLNFFQILVGLQ